MNLTPTIIELSERFRRPSNIGRLADCNAQAFMAAAVQLMDGDAPAAPEANLGNQIHSYVEAGAREAVDSWEASTDRVCKLAQTDGLDSWSVHCIRATLEFYADLVRKYQIEPENILPEHPLDMASTGFRRKGTSDLVLVIPFELVVIVDLKAGFVDQGDAEDHDQMAVYAAAAAETFKAKKVIVWLWQPRAEKDRRATAAEFDAEALRNATEWANGVLFNSRQPTARLKAGFNQCSTCPALRRCPAARKMIMDVQEALAVLGDPTTPEAWGEALGAAKLAEKWADTWKDAGKAHLLTGGAADGFKLGTGRAIRSVADVPGAIAKLRDAGLEAEALDAASLSVGKLPPQAVQIIADHITEKVSDPPLVADKRSRHAA